MSSAEQSPVDDDEHRSRVYVDATCRSAAGIARDIRLIAS